MDAGNLPHEPELHLQSERKTMKFTHARAEQTAQEDDVDEARDQEDDDFFGSDEEPEVDRRDDADTDDS